MRERHPSTRRPGGRRPALAALLGAALALALACSPESPPDSTRPREAEAAPAARVSGETITVADLDARIKERLFRRETHRGDPSRVYELRRDALEDLVNRRLLEMEAERQGLSPEALLEERLGEAAAVEEEEVRAYYERNRERLSGSFEEAAPRIRRELARRARGEAVRRFLESLRERHGVEVVLERPRFELGRRGPARGPADAPVTLVAFGDYACSHCRRAERVLEQLRERYPERLRLVYRHFPLEPMHPRARAAAEAAVCAEAQGRFWAMHEELVAAEELGAEALAARAEAAGLALPRFRECLEDPETARRVEADVEAGREAGVSAIPTFFVNGIPLRGAQPLDRFVELVERELEGAEAAGGRAARR